MVYPILQLGVATLGASVEYHADTKLFLYRVQAGPYVKEGIAYDAN